MGKIFNKDMISLLKIWPTLKKAKRYTDKKIIMMSNNISNNLRK